MLITILVLLFVLIFVVLAWRIVAQAKNNIPKQRSFVCPDCNEADCVCHEKRDEQNGSP